MKRDDCTVYTRVDEVTERNHCKPEGLYGWKYDIRGVRGVVFVHAQHYWWIIPMAADRKVVEMLIILDISLGV